MEDRISILKAEARDLSEKITLARIDLEVSKINRLCLADPETLDEQIKGMQQYLDNLILRIAILLERRTSTLPSYEKKYFFAKSFYEK